MRIINTNFTYRHRLTRIRSSINDEIIKNELIADIIAKSRAQLYVKINANLGLFVIT